ncbi:hypothetical protein HB852_14385 [Listeria grandensis]|uniref:hypothetical protein n=1 Tax=Listeria grandensis TaxID=1494963 RepID=UPI0016245108|nr:hypothetical protein [Listeria grandensis]MBC1475800.1 hypothetical protein [Listeria grandensis]
MDTRFFVFSEAIDDHRWGNKIKHKKTTEEKGGTSVVKKGVLRIFIQKGENEGSLVVVSLYSYNTDYEGKPAVS